MEICFTSVLSSLVSAPRPRFPGRLVALVVVLGLCAAGQTGGATFAQAPADSLRPVQAQDLYRMEAVRDVQISPHGRSVAYTVRHIVSGAQQPGNAAAAYRSQLYVAPMTSGRSSRLLARSDRPIRQPAWHPDGTHLAYVRAVKGTPQVFVVSLSGGVPYQLTDTPHGAQRPQWSPNGERLLFASALPERVVARSTGHPAPSERPGRTSRDLSRTVPPDTVLVLRHARSLDALDTLALGPQNRILPPDDTARTLRAPRDSGSSDSLAAPLVDRLARLSSDSLQTLFDELQLRPDTTTIPVTPDTAAAPGGNLVQVRRWMDRNRRQNAALVSTRLDLHGERRLRPTPTYRHHFVVNVPTGLRSGRPPRPAARPVTRGYRSYGRATWLPGSGQIVVSGTPPGDRMLDRVQQRNLYVVDLNRDRTRRLLRIDNHALTDPRVTTDGTTIAFRIRALSDTIGTQAELGLFALDGRSQPRVITGGFDRDVGTFRWSPGGWYLYATASDRGGRSLYRFTPFARDTSAQDGPPTMSPDRATSRDTFRLDATMMAPAEHRQMTAETRAVHAFDITDATAVYAATGPTTPSALYANTVSFGNERPLATPNADWLTERQIAAPTRTAMRHDSLDVAGWVTRSPIPSGPSPSPLLVQVRGGPSTLSTPHTPGAWFERQYLAGRGLGVVEVWPRGATGFGSAFQRANDQNWGPGPAQDVLAFTDSVAAQPWADSSQVALSGTGYGATVATWLLGHTNRFAAGVALNGVYDLPALLDTGQAWRTVPREFGGYPWTDSLTGSAGRPAFSGRPASGDSASTPRSTLHRNSPITYADQIDTPLLLLQGGMDQRVGPSQGERLYKRLKILERPVEYVRYPAAGHDMATSATPRQRLDRLVRTSEFLTRFLPLRAAPVSQ